VILHVVAVFDSAAQVFQRPFFVPRIEVARRAFADEVNRADAANQLHQHPEDFSLYVLGTFNDEVGTLSSLDVPTMVVRAKELLS